MKRGTKKSPVTKEQLYQEQERKHKQVFIKEKFYPALCEATVSVDESGMLLQAVTALIMEEAMETLRSTKMRDVKSRIVKKLTGDDERVPQIQRLIELFDGMTLFDTRAYVEGMKAVIEQMKIDEMSSRKLETLKADWARYLVK